MAPRISLAVLGVMSIQPFMAVGGDDQTDVTGKLNSLLASRPGKVYTGGTGVIIRNLNDGMTKNPPGQVVPGSFLVNDIVSASVAYPTGNPMCPNAGWSGYNNVQACSDDPWLQATVLIVVGSAMSKLFRSFDQIQHDDWGWGVFYAADANAADQRCRWVQEHNGYDCPGGWIPWSGAFQPDSSKKGAGNYPSGNPNAGAGGGGAGCHFSKDGSGIDQFDSDMDPNLVGNQWCECNYNLKGNGWEDWVSHWILHGKAKDAFSWEAWFEGGKRKAPSWAVDLGTCWVNNVRDMIELQNMLWFHKYDWSNQLLPASNWDPNRLDSLRYYWGWNEVPLDAKIVHDPSNWDAIVIKIPVAACGQSGQSSANCLNPAAHQNLEDQLAWHEQNGFLKPGLNNIKNRPGSYIVFLKEWSHDPDHWQRSFYCENWSSPSGKYQVIFQPKSASSSTGLCYVDYGKGPAPTPAPPSPPPAPSPCSGSQGKFRLNKHQDLCLDVPGGAIKNGARLQVWNCNGQPQQEWIWCSDSRIVSASNKNMCIDRPGTAAGALGPPPPHPSPLQLWECNGHPGQSWGYDSKSMAVYQSASGHAMCMDLWHGHLVPGNNVIVWGCNPSHGDGEAWLLGDGELVV
mmetsp:Transcript_650/g.1144  ORF Transcript_650/g.1144 Transcript_650/m.1144 type:complete len:625 (-) Transcript_650:130-2004(-)